MADGVTIQVEGLAGLEEALKQIGADAKKALRSGVRAGLVVIQKDARSRIHKVSGDLAKSLTISVRVSPDEGTVTGKLRAGNKQSHIARFVELGTLPHVISAYGGKQVSAKEARRLNRNPRKAAQNLSPSFAERAASGQSLRDALPALKIGAYGGYFERVDHPGAQPKPFLRPAADTKFTEAVDTVATATKTAIEKIKAKKTKN